MLGISNIMSLWSFILWSTDVAVRRQTSISLSYSQKGFIRIRIISPHLKGINKLAHLVLMEDFPKYIFTNFTEFKPREFLSMYIHQLSQYCLKFSIINISISSSCQIDMRKYVFSSYMLSIKTCQNKLLSFPLQNSTFLLLQNQNYGLKKSMPLLSQN